MNKQALPIFQVKVTLLNVDPPVWRRLLVRCDTTLAELHAVLQTAMGWQNSHLHQFRIGNVSFSYPYEPDHLIELTAIDSTVVHLYNIIPSNFPFRDDEHPFMEYEYDFGDGWLHQLDFEAVLTPEPGQKTPLCVDGARACPPEDCGGPYGYRDFLDALNNPEHPEHDSYTEWIGGRFNAEAFDVKQTNGRIRQRRQYI